MKRVHLEVVWRVTAPLLEEAECELTPARFDMMRIVYLRTMGVMQGNLQQLLGVSQPTVSVMLASLEELGMVTRTRCPYDGRCRVVHITERGRRCVERAIEAVSMHGDDDWAVARAATGKPAKTVRGRPTRPPMEELHRLLREAAPQVKELDRTLERMRKGLRDRASFHHPWRSSDLGKYVPITIEDILRTVDPDFVLPPSPCNPPWRLPPEEEEDMFDWAD